MSGGSALLVDFGTSRAKAAALDLDSGALGASAELASPSPTWGSGGEVEVDPYLLAQTWSRLLNEMVAAPGGPPVALWLCAEMHGFVLDDGHGKALTPYISWRDQRASHPPHALERFEREFGPAFQQITGMKLRPGIPAVVLAHLGAIKKLPRNARFLSLPEWLIVATGRHTGLAHASIAAASGLYDLGSHGWSARILEASGTTRAGIRVHEIAETPGQPIGTIELQGRHVEVFGGIGDLQAAMLGAGVPERTDVAFNMGTGSQVARALKEHPGLKGERRPFFAGNILATMTHIPAGRALNVFSELVYGFAVGSGGRAGTFWELLCSASPEAILAAPLKVDLNVFASAWRLKKGGTISVLLEGTATPDKLVTSIARAWLCQYAEALQELDPRGESARISVAGGLARRIPATVPVLCALLGRPVRPPALEEETLLGLALLARRLIQ